MMEKFFSKCDSVIKYVSAFSLAAMVLLVFTNTMLRYFVNSSIVSTEEVCRFFFVWATFLSVITVWHEKGHIAVTMLTDRLHGKTLLYFNFFWSFLSVFIFIALVYGCYDYIGQNSYYAQITGISYGFMILPILLSGALCLLITINNMYKTLTGRQAERIKGQEG